MCAAFEGVVAVKVRGGFAVFGELVERPLPVPDELIRIIKPEIVHHILVEQKAPEAVPAHEVRVRHREVVRAADRCGVEEDLIPPFLAEVNRAYFVKSSVVALRQPGARGEHRHIYGVVGGVAGHHEGVELGRHFVVFGVHFLQSVVHFRLDFGVPVVDGVVYGFAVDFLGRDGAVHIPEVRHDVPDDEGFAAKIDAVVERVGFFDRRCCVGALVGR